MLRHEGDRLCLLLPVQVDDLPLKGPQLVNGQVFTFGLATSQRLAEDPFRDSRQLHVNMFDIRIANKRQEQNRSPILRG